MSCRDTQQMLLCPLITWKPDERKWILDLAEGVMTGEVPKVVPGERSCSSHINWKDLSTHPVLHLYSQKCYAITRHFLISRNYWAF